MSLQSIYAKSENAAVVVAFFIFIAAHAGLLFLFDLV